MFGDADSNVNVEADVDVDADMYGDELRATSGRSSSCSYILPPTVRPGTS